MEKKVLKIAILTVLLVFVYATIVQAYTYSVTLTPSSQTVAESTEFLVVVKVSNIDVGNNGLNSLSGYFKYDQDIFETINDTSIEALNGWGKTYTASNNKITLTKTTFVKEEEGVFQVTLKTKAGTSGKTGKISFENITGSNSAEDIMTQNSSTSITVGEETGNVANAVVNNVVNNAPTLVINTVPANNTVNNSTYNITYNTIYNTVNNVTNNSVSQYVNNSSSNTNIPYTGVEDTVVYIIGAAVLVAVIFYIKFEKINKDMK